MQKQKTGTGEFEQQKHDKDPFNSAHKTRHIPPDSSPKSLARRSCDDSDSSSTLSPDEKMAVNFNEYRELERRNEELQSKLAEAQSKVAATEEAMQETQRLTDKFATNSYLDKMKMALKATKDKKLSEEVIKDLNERLSKQHEDLSNSEKVCTTTTMRLQASILSQEDERDDETEEIGVLDMTEQPDSRHMEEQHQDAAALMRSAMSQMKREKKLAQVTMSKKDSSIEVLSGENRQLREENEEILKKCESLESMCSELTDTCNKHKVDMELEKRQAKVGINRKNSSIESLNRENKKLKEEKEEMEKKCTYLEKLVEFEKHKNVIFRQKVLQAVEDPIIEEEHKRKRDHDCGIKEDDCKQQTKKVQKGSSH